MRTATLRYVNNVRLPQVYAVVRRNWQRYSGGITQARCAAFAATELTKRPKAVAGTVRRKSEVHEMHWTDQAIRTELAKRRNQLLNHVAQSSDYSASNWYDFPKSCDTFKLIADLTVAIDVLDQARIPNVSGPDEAA